MALMRYGQFALPRFNTVFDAGFVQLGGEGIDSVLWCIGQVI